MLKYAVFILGHNHYSQSSTSVKLTAKHFPMYIVEDIYYLSNAFKLQPINHILSIVSKKVSNDFKRLQDFHCCE